MSGQGVPTVSEEMKAHFDAAFNPPAPPATAPPAEHIMQFFTFAHLPPKLAMVSKPFADLANEVILNLPRNPERTVALRKLLEAKDAAVRAFIAVPT